MKKIILILISVVTGFMAIAQSAHFQQLQALKQAHHGEQLPDILDDGLPEAHRAALKQHQMMQARTYMAALRSDDLIKLDSTRNEFQLRKFEYDALGNNTLLHRTNFGFLGISSKNYTLYGWDGSLLISETRYNVDLATGEESIADQWIYTYDENDYLNFRQRSVWNAEQEALLPVVETAFENSPEGWVLLLTTCAYDGGDVCVNTAQSTYTYDANGNELERVSTTWNTSAEEFEPSSRRLSTFENALLGGYINFLWSGDDWEPVTQWQFEYNEAALVLEEQILVFDQTLGEWRPNSLDQYEYDDDNFLTSLTFFNYNQSQQQFTPSAQNLLTYDAAGNIESAIFQNWFNNTWNVLESSLFFVNEDFLFEQAIYPDGEFEGVPLFNVVDKIETTFPFDGKGPGTETTHFYYSAFGPLRVDDASALEHRVYPNPTSSAVWMELPADVSGGVLQLFDLQGKLLEQFNFTGRAQFDLGAYAPGVYVYTLRASSGTARGKLIKQ